MNEKRSLSGISLLNDGAVRWGGSRELPQRQAGDGGDDEDCPKYGEHHPTSSFRAQWLTLFTWVSYCPQRAADDQPDAAEKTDEIENQVRGIHIFASYDSPRPARLQPLTGSLDDPVAEREEACRMLCTGLSR